MPIGLIVDDPVERDQKKKLQKRPVASTLVRLPLYSFQTSPTTAAAAPATPPGQKKKKVVPDGIEPPALALLVPRSNQLSYGTEREGPTERERKGEGTTSLMWASNVELNRSPTSLTSGTPHLILCVSFGIFGST